VRKRIKWKASEVGTAMNLARNFDWYMANVAWCERYRKDDTGQWVSAAKRTLLALRDMGLPDEILKGLIGLNHPLSEFGIEEQSF